MSIVQRWRNLAAVVAVAMVAMVATTSQASAATITLTAAEEDAFLFVGSAGDAPQAYLNTGGGNYQVIWPSNADDYSVALSQVVLAAARGNAGDTFNLFVYNNNGATWDFSASINGDFPPVGPVAIPNLGGLHVFSFVLPAGGLTSVQLYVGGDLPLPGGVGTDRGAEYRLTTVPEGGSTVAFLGLGLMVVGLVTRKILV